jgi:hypothetical protein
MAERIRTEVGSLEETRRTFRQIDRLLAALGRSAAGTTATAAQVLTLTAKGSLVTHDGRKEDELVVGPNGQIVVANSAETEGLQWVPRGERHFTLLAAGAEIAI